MTNNPGQTYSQPFSWNIMRLFLEGFSPIDLESLACTTPEEAQEFLKLYGFDLSNPEDREELDFVLQEALMFLEIYLSPALEDRDFDLYIPDNIRQNKDITQLLLWASQTQRDLRAAWSCAVIRLMHTIHHANYALKIQEIDSIREQIFEPFKRHIQQVSEDHIQLGSGSTKIKLFQVNYRENKARDSIILKLLHKSDNVASNVYDRVGIQLVTYTPTDAMLVLKYLRKHNIVSIANITPGRSRNTLINFQKFKNLYDSTAQSDQETSEDSLDEIFMKSIESSPHNSLNPHSSSGFKSIQFTCRQLVNNPSQHFLQLLKARDQYPLGSESYQALNKVLVETPEYTKILFPYEVQILDQASFQDSKYGKSSYKEYKKRQLRSARKRVLKEVIALSQHSGQLETPEHFNPDLSFSQGPVDK